MAYAELEPFGPDAEAWRAGIVAATIANVNRDTKKRPEPFTPQDFMPAQPETPEERQAALQARINAAMMRLGGRARRPDDPPRARRRKQGDSDGA
jgi:hypothetical protein